MDFNYYEPDTTKRDENFFSVITGFVGLFLAQLTGIINFEFMEAASIDIFKNMIQALLVAACAGAGGWMGKELVIFLHRKFVKPAYFKFINRIKKNRRK